jgi:RimJ/RimL family protein N-acetyltransferase
MANFRFPIPPDLVLEGPYLRLVPMQAEHLDDLVLAGQDARTWQFYSFDASVRSRMERFVTETLAEQAAGTKFPFVMICKDNNQIIGSSSLYEFSPHQNLEVGHTWIDAQHWGQGYNEAAKLLMLGYCFEQLRLLRVHFKVWDQNQRSQRAMLRIGATFEGFTRRHIIREDGIVRTSAIFSILDKEWEGVKAGLVGVVNSHKKVD